MANILPFPRTVVELEVACKMLGGWIA